MVLDVFYYAIHLNISWHNNSQCLAEAPPPPPPAGTSVATGPGITQGYYLDIIWILCIYIYTVYIYILYIYILYILCIYIYGYNIRIYEISLVIACNSLAKWAADPGMIKAGFGFSNRCGSQQHEIYKGHGESNHFFSIMAPDCLDSELWLKRWEILTDAEKTGHSQRCYPAW